MKKLSQYIGEYFLGTETRKFYRYYRKFLSEYAIGPGTSGLKRIIRNSKTEEAAELIIGKAIPNLIDIITVGYSLITKNPPYMLIAGEGLRLTCMSISGKKEKRLFMNSLKSDARSRDICDKLE